MSKWVNVEGREDEGYCLPGWRRLIPGIEKLRLKWPVRQPLSAEVRERLQKAYDKLFR
jgi:hypothetical protein